MSLTISLARSVQEKREIYKLRYSVYTREMNLFTSSADHNNKLLMDPEDETAQFLYAHIENKIIGAIRFHPGYDNDLPQKYITLYDIEPFFDFINPKKIVIVSRLAVDQEYRGGRTPLALIIACYEFCLENGIELGFCDCAPHLIHLYSRLGWRRYSSKSISDTEFGILIPLCLILYDDPYFVSIGSLFHYSLKKIKKTSEPPKWINRIFPAPPLSAIERRRQEEIWVRDFKLLTEAKKINVFEGIPEKSVEDLIKIGDMIECKRGQPIIKKGTVYRNIFIILDGKVEVRKGKKIIAILSEGEIFGEIAFLLKTGRSSDVFAASDYVRVVSIREQEIQKFSQSDAAIASHFFYNISRILCMRIVEVHQLL